MGCGMGILGVAGAVLLAGGAARADLAATDLRCEYRVDPLGIDEPKPRLSWVLASDARGQVQRAYRILVASRPESLVEDRADLWDSGRVASDRTTQIPYGGKPLRSRMTCWWRVRVWDRDRRPSAWSEPARWTMGLLEPRDWKAAWIGYDAPPPSVEGRPTRGIDLRGCKWIWFPEGGAAKRASIGTRLFRRRFTLPPTRGIRRARLIVTADDQFEAFVNGKRAGASDGQADAWRRPATLDVTGLVRPGANVLAIAATNTSEGPAGLAAKLLIEPPEGEPVAIVTDGAWKASDEAPDGAKAPAFDDGAWPTAREVAKVGDAPWGIPGEAGGKALRLPPPPYLRGEFAVEKPIRRAVVHATALGLYRLWINGRRVGGDAFTPGWSDYRKRVYYNTYEVTDLVRRGPNAMGAILADGWYAGYVGWGRIRERYGSEPRLRVQLEIERADGTVDVVATGPSWKAAYGPTREADLLMGETYDARLAMDGWTEPGFDDAGWAPVAVTEGVAPRLEAYPGVPVRRMLELRPQRITEPADGIHVFDMGQNMVGWVRLKVRGERGDRIRLRFAEMLNPDGTIYTTNLRGARATDTYILRGGGDEVWEPAFTFHGFRYVEVTGLRAEPFLETIRGVVVYSAAPRTGWFTCSHPMVDQLYRNLTWGQRGNYLEVPTDCPQRDERLGWTGDAEIFIRTGTYNMDVSAFFTKWLVDLEDGQHADGAFPHVAPDVGAGAGSPAWADAGIICPYTLYRVYGDTRGIERHWKAMTTYMAHLEKNNKGLLRPAVGYGDWLAVGANTPKDVIATAYFAYDAALMAEMAAVIGRREEAARYRKLAEDVKAAFNAAYVGEDGRVRGDTQTAYALALYMDLLPPEKRGAAFRHLVAALGRRDVHISTGFVGVRHLMPVLARFGRMDLAYRLLTNDTYPSWGYSIRHGATTIWERWDGWTEEKGFQDPGMNSFNHYAFGSVGEWLFAVVGGIDTDGPGFKRLRIRPRPGGGLTRARATYRSIHGPIASAWSLSAGRIRMQVTIPANTRATVYVPARRPEDVREGGAPAGEAEGVRFLRMEDGAAVFDVGSGTYRFRSVWPGEGA